MRTCFPLSGRSRGCGFCGCSWPRTLRGWWLARFRTNWASQPPLCRITWKSSRMRISSRCAARAPSCGTPPILQCWRSCSGSFTPSAVPETRRSNLPRSLNLQVGEEHGDQDEDAVSLHREFLPHPDGGSFSPELTGDEFEIVSAGAEAGQLDPEPEMAGRKPGGAEGDRPRSRACGAPCA